ncbi:DUF551 domain-containing protein [Enterobacter roggenkampii]|uniref:DUF551 domain-containing protein n=1 Tax=Enterobacter roggenkampii TaxID=1812935 RepID=UPI00133101D6|nr:DUF551 domain-containing protein [Enterobacter roggenkampii]
MSTISKERVKGILDFGAGRIISPITDDEIRELARIALASLEAEAVEWRVAFRLDGQPGSDFEKTFENQAKMNEIICLHERAGFSASITPLYTAPPAPVSVPDITALDGLAGEMLNHAMNCERRVAVAYTHCAHRLAEEVRDLRAAMLQGADGNAPVIPDGWVACSERMPPFGEYLVMYEFGCPGGPLKHVVARYMSFDRNPPNKDIVSDWVCGMKGVHNITHWQPLPAAPQQEA